MSICSSSHVEYYLQTGYPFNQQKKTACDICFSNQFESVIGS